MEYNTGNLEKYTTKNPLKRQMISKLNEKIVDRIGRYVSLIKSKELTILDAGCGEGFIDRLLLEKFAHVDIVMCTEVLEHVREPEAALKELIRVAKNFILITVPHEPWFCLGNLLVLKNVSRLGNPIDHINHWTED